MRPRFVGRGQVRRPLVTGALVAAMLVLVGAAGPAHALPILDAVDAQELVQELAEATAVQGICYGWDVTVDDAAGTYSGVDMGSSRGVGIPAQACDEWMVFEAFLTYTSESSETEDSATFRVTSSVIGAPAEQDLRRVGIDGAALLGGNDDLAIVNAVRALPALAAERGLVPPLVLERNTGDIPAVDRPTPGTGSDWTRTYGGFILLTALFMIGGLTWAGGAWAVDRFDRHIGIREDA